MILSLILARATNGVVGRQGALPWRSKTDLSVFRAKTIGRTVIMGRKTWLSLPERPLPSRRNVIVTSNLNLYPPPGVWLSTSLDAALYLLQDRDEEVLVIGGPRLWAEALPRADRVYHTTILADVAGDTVYALDLTGFRRRYFEHVPASDRDEHALFIEEYEREREPTTLRDGGTDVSDQTTAERADATRLEDRGELLLGPEHLVGVSGAPVADVPVDPADDPATARAGASSGATATPSTSGGRWNALSEVGMTALVLLLGVAIGAALGWFILGL